MFRFVILEQFENLKILRDLYSITGLQSPAVFFHANLVDYLTLK